MMDPRKKASTTFVSTRSVTRSKQISQLTLPGHESNSLGDANREIVTQPDSAYNFSRLSIHPPIQSLDIQPSQAKELSCPLASASPRACPFGGACHTCPVQLQTKLAVNKPGDEYEQEADRVAEQVIRIPDISRYQVPPVVAISKTSAVQRAPENNEDEEDSLQRKEPSVGKAATAYSSSFVPPIVNEVLRSPGQPLDAQTRAFMEPRFGHDFSQVRVHTDTHAAASARAVSARAYTVGSDMVFGAGQYAPGTSAGPQLIAHELTHVVQQRQNQQALTTLRVGRTDKTLEADVERSATSPSTDNSGTPLSTTEPKAGMVQRAGPAAAAVGGAAAGAFVAGFGIAFGIDYLSMTRTRAERYARELDTLYPGWLNLLPNCPCEVPDRDTANWVRDSNPDLQTYHPGATYSYRSTAAATGGSRHGQQCTYDAAARLITSGPAAGTPDVYSPSWGVLNVPYHIVYDVKTWKELGWSTYNRYWRPNNGMGCRSNDGSQQAR